MGQICKVLGLSPLSTRFYNGSKRKEYFLTQKIPEGTLSSDEYLNRMVAFLIKQYRPVWIYLFGSKARGEDTPDSDYDMLVVVPKKVTWKYRKKVHRAKWEAGLRQATDILLWTKRSFENQLTVKCSLPSTVVAEGKLLYEATRR